MAKEVFSFSGNDARNYDTYLGPVLFEPSAVKLLSHIGSSNIRSVLEIACGTGRLTRHLRKYFPATTTLVASDISPDMIEVAREKTMDPTIEFHVADAQQLPFADESFDLVVCQYGLMFLPDKLKGFKEAFRVLKKGGRFIFSTWDSTDNIPILKIIYNDAIIPFFKDGDATRFLLPFSLYEPEKLKGFLDASGFTDSSVVTIEFKGQGSSPQDIINAFFLKHSIGREVAGRDPSAPDRLADEMKRRITKEFGERDLLFDLKALVGVGQKHTFYYL